MGQREGGKRSVRGKGVRGQSGEGGERSVRGKGVRGRVGGRG